MIVSIDLTSLHGVAQALTSKSPCDWSVASYYEVATALLQMDQIRVPVPPKAPKMPRYIVRPIQDAFGANTSYGRKQNREALTYSLNIDKKTKAKIKNAVERPPQQYKTWLDWHVEKEWREHIEILPGLVQAEYIPQIAEILGRSPEELKAINDESRWKPREACSNPTKLQKQMFTGNCG